MSSQILRAMVEYFGSDLAQTYHALNVYSLARIIGMKEGLDGHKLQVLEYAAALHDIGKPESQRIYNSTVGKYQEIMGRKVSGELMTSLGYPRETVEQVGFLIGNHHSFGVDGGLSLQILIEANTLANLRQARQDGEAPIHLREEYFRTKTGTELITTMFSLYSLPEECLVPDEVTEHLPVG